MPHQDTVSGVDEDAGASALALVDVGGALGFTPPDCPDGCGSADTGIQPAQIDPTSEREALRGRADMLQAELESIRQRLDEIDASAKTR